MQNNSTFCIDHVLKYEQYERDTAQLVNTDHLFNFPLPLPLVYPFPQIYTLHCIHVIT